MVRTLIAPTAVPTKFAIVPATVTLVAGDVANGNEFVSTGRESLLVQNSDASPHTITIASFADAYGRTGDITAYSVPAGAFRIFQMFPQEGWAQTNGKINVNVNHAGILLAVLTFP